MSTIKKYLGSRSTLEIKREILKDFSEALNLELKVELATSEDNDLFTRSTFELKLDNGVVRYIHCDIFDLIQCFELNKKEAIDNALLERFNNLGSFKSNYIYVEHVGNNFHFFELVPREMNHYTSETLSFIRVAKIDSVEIPAIKEDVEKWLKSHGGIWCDLKENLDLVDWDIVEENQISGTYRPN